MYILTEKLLKCTNDPKQGAGSYLGSENQYLTAMNDFRLNTLKYRLLSGHDPRWQFQAHFCHAHSHSVEGGQPDLISPLFLSLIPPFILKPKSSSASAVSSACACAHFSDVCPKAVERSGDTSRNGTFRIKCGGGGLLFTDE